MKAERRERMREMLMKGMGGCIKRTERALYQERVLYNVRIKGLIYVGLSFLEGYIV